MDRRALWAVVIAAWAATLLLPPPSAQADVVGKLSGKVVNEKKEPLPGVNVRIEAARKGVVSDDQGRFVIVGVPAGEYLVKANAMGYAAFVAEKVMIRPDFTTELTIAMRIEAVEMPEVRVEAERPLLQKDATGTTRFMNGEDIQKLPTRGYRDAAAQQTGVVNFQRQIDNESQNSNTLIIRGGRPNETAYFVDGFSQQDPLTGTSSTSISNNAIEEVVLLTGGFSPEYGRIMSGAVNVVTREGGDKYSGSLEAVTDNLSGGWVGAPKTDYNVYDGSIGGPIIPGNDRLSFYASGERRWQRDRFQSFIPDATKAEYRSLGLNDNFAPQNSSAGYTYQGKISYSITDKTTLKLGSLGSEDKWQEYAHSYLFNLPHTPRYLDRNQSYTATLNQALNDKTYYNVGISFFDTKRKRGDGVYFEDLYAYYTATGGTDSTPSNNPRFDQDVPVFVTPGRVVPGYLQRRSSYYGVQGAFTSQINSHHQLKFGGDLQRHTLRFFQHYAANELGGQVPNAKDFNAYGYDLTFDTVPYTYFDASGDSFVTVPVVRGVHINESDGGRDGAKHPKNFSLFAQDKFEREGVVVNGGIRYDYLTTDTDALIDPLQPLGGRADPTNSTLDANDLTTNKTYQRFSPRVGIAFPVDDRTILRFNYGKFFQQPNLQDLYTSYRFLEYKVKSGGYFVGFGNPNLRPERTTAYETGVQRLFGDHVRFDLTAYYKDVKDLVEIVNVPSTPKSFNTYRNRDFATIKGLDFGVTMRPINHVSGSLNYSLSYAQGTGSVSNSQGNIAWTAKEPPKQTAPLDFDQRHKLSMNADWRLDKGEGPKWNGAHWFENFGVNVLFNVASGTPYTPTAPYNELTLANVSTVPIGPVNSRYGPWSTSLDLKVDRGFHLWNVDLSAYAWVLNAFDAHNAATVFTSTGSPETTGFLDTSEGQGAAADAASKGKDYEGLYNVAQNNPSFYTNPRLVRFGIRTQF